MKTTAKEGYREIQKGFGSYYENLKAFLEQDGGLTEDEAERMIEDTNN